MKTVIDLVTKIKEKFTMRKDIAPVESSSTASRAYSAGDNFFYGNLLQKATTDIAQGAALAGGTNFENADPVCATIQNLSNNLNKNGSKNLYPYYPVGFSRKRATVVETWEDDGVVDVSGTATSPGAFFVEYESEPIYGCIDGQEYKLTGCPSGGATNKYYIYIYDVTASGYAAQDIGSGATFTYHSDHVYNLGILITTGTTASHLKFRPMICLKSDYDLDSSFVPPAMTNRQLTKETTGLIDNQNVNGAKNRLNLNFSKIKAINNSGSWSNNVYTYRNVTFTLTVDENNNITKIVVNGTANANAAFFLANRQENDNSDLIAMLKANSYVPSLRAEISTNVVIKIDFYSSLSSYLSTWHSPDNKSAVTIPSNATIADVYFTVQSGNTANNVSVYPMISLENIYKVDPTFVPYAKSNKELTDKVTPVSGTPTNATGIANANANAIYKVGNLVVWNMFVKATAAISNGGTIMTLPFAPSSRIHFQAAKNYTTPSLLKVETTGVVTLSTGSLAIDDVLIATLAYETND